MLVTFRQSNAKGMPKKCLRDIGRGMGRYFGGLLHFQYRSNGESNGASIDTSYFMPYMDLYDLLYYVYRSEVVEVGAQNGIGIPLPISLRQNFGKILAKSVFAYINQCLMNRRLFTKASFALHIYKS